MIPTQNNLLRLFQNLYMIKDYWTLRVILGVFSYLRILSTFKIVCSFGFLYNII